jgi:hypothetical protein
VEYSYDDIIRMKQDCYEVIKKYLGEDHLRVFKYHKGDLLPLIHTDVRKNMTCGDIDAFQWDYQKRVFRIIECKRRLENNKSSQNTFLNFLSTIQIPGYTFRVLKIIGDPPFERCEVINIKTGIKKIITRSELIKILNME